MSHVHDPGEGGLTQVAQLRASAASLVLIAAACSDAGRRVEQVVSDAAADATAEATVGVWLGVAATEAQQAHRRQRCALERLAALLHQAARALYRLAGGLESARLRWARAWALAEACGLRSEGPSAGGGPLSASGLGTGPFDAAVFGTGLAAPPPCLVADPAGLRRRLEEATEAARAADEAAAAALAAVTAEIGRLSGHDDGSLALDLLTAPQSQLLVRLGALDRSALPETLVLPEIGQLIGAGDPAALRAYAESLSAAQRHSLITAHPELIGPADGLPVAMRYAANRRLMELALERAAPQRAQQLAALLADPFRQFLLFDPRGDGRVVEVLGDLDTARHVAVLVPGICSTLGNFRTHLEREAATVQRAADALAPGAVATVAWLGYDTPGIADAPLPGKARAGASRLVGGLAGLPHRPGTTTTVVAHSYGSLVAGEALRQGLRADNVVVAGSPGMGVRSVHDFRFAPGTALYALRAPGDVVSWSENFGRDPSDPRFGATRLATGLPASGGSIGHTDYFAERSESVRNIARVVVGDSADLTVRPPSSLDLAVDAAADVVAPARGPSDPVTHLIDRLHDPDLYWDVLGDEAELDREAS